MLVTIATTTPFLVISHLVITGTNDLEEIWLEIATDELATEEVAGAEETTLAELTLELETLTEETADELATEDKAQTPQNTTLD